MARRGAPPKPAHKLLDVEFKVRLTARDAAWLMEVSEHTGVAPAALLRSFFKKAKRESRNDRRSLARQQLV